MEEKIDNNPLNNIFKHSPSGIILEEIENPSNFNQLFDYLKDNKNSNNNKKKIIDQFTNIIKIQRSVCAYLSTYENKSIYIFFFELYYDSKSSKELKQSIINLIMELNKNVQLSKKVYEYIFQKFSQLYRKDQKLLSHKNQSSTFFNEYFYYSLALLYSSFEDEDKNDNPRNYFSCFGNSNFTVNFDQKILAFGKNLTFIINFKISRSKLITEHSKDLGKCNLIKINFLDNKKILEVELQYPFFVILNDGKKQYNSKVCPLGEWMNLIVSISLMDDNLKVYFFLNGENALMPINLKQPKLTINEIINSIIFFDNFYGEVTSMSMISINDNESFNVFTQSLKSFRDIKTGLWDKKNLKNFINFFNNTIYKEKKNEKEKNFKDNIVFMFTPFNYDIDTPNLVKDCCEKYNLVINGNIQNHKYQNYQNKLIHICNINNFIPIAEMFLIYQKELLNEQNFLLYLKIINKIARGKNNIIKMNRLDFFKLLSIFMENYPDIFYNEKTLKEFDNIGKTILTHKIKDFSSNFFNDIIYNRKIILKFSKELQIKFWHMIVDFCLSGETKIESVLNFQKMCLLLLYYDRSRHNEICCTFHLNMYKKEFIGNMKVMEPTLSQRLINLEKFLNVAILKQNPSKIICFFKLLMLDLSPCSMKFILKIFSNALDFKNKNEEWKNQLGLEIINCKYDIILINAFIHSLPDVRYEILVLVYYIFLRFVKLNKLSDFQSFEKMIKTCLLPNEIFYMKKKINDIINISNSNNYGDDKKDEKGKFFPTRTSKSNSIYILPSTLQLNNINNKQRKKVGEMKKIFEGSAKTVKFQNPKNNEKMVLRGKKEESPFIQFESDNNLNINNIIKNNKNKKDDKNEEKKLLRSSTLIKKSSDDFVIEYIHFKKGESIYNRNTNKDQTLIFRDELYDIYVNCLYLLFIEWTLGVPIVYNSEEIFSSLKQQKDISPKKQFIANVNIFEFLFVLNQEINSADFTIRIIKKIETLIKRPENSYIILSNLKIYSLLLDIVFKYYINNKENNCSELDLEILKTGKNILMYIFINSLYYLSEPNNDLPMEQLEILFFWGEKNILSEINNNEKVDSILDFIYEILIDIFNKFKEEFEDVIKKEFYSNFDPMQLQKNYALRNYLVYLTFIYNFCFHFKMDPIIKNSDIDTFVSVSLNINIPDIFISGMRLDNSKGNNIEEYWKDYQLIEKGFQIVNYIFNPEYIKLKLKIENKKKENKKEKSLNYDKYNNILNELILNKDKKDLFKKELFFLCYYETNKRVETIIPLIKIISITQICILSVVKDNNNAEQFKHWLKEYKHLLKFIILASTNLDKNANVPNTIKIYNRIQSICLDVISSGLCFLNNLYECATMCQEDIKRCINNIFLLCFSILKYHFSSIKSNSTLIFFSSKTQQFDISSSAILLLFNDYIKDKNKAPYMNLNKLEKYFLNPSFQIILLINESDFYEAFFENKNLKKLLSSRYYSINNYKIKVDSRYNSLRTLDDKIDYSYEINILDLLPIFGKELLKYSNFSAKNSIKRKNLYIKQKKILFSWNGFWSNRELFYGEKKLNKIKYKVLNHYTNNLMKPLLFPILDMNYYLPPFKEFDKNKLFKQNEENKQNNDSSYDLILDLDKILKLSTKQENEITKEKKNRSKTAKKLGCKNTPNYLALYKNTNPKLYELVRNISKAIEVDKKENIEDNEEESNKKENNDEEKDDDISDITNNNDTDRKDTAKTSSSTIKIKKENLGIFGDIKSASYDKDIDKKNNVGIINNKEYYICCLVKASHHVKGYFYLEEKKIIFKSFVDQRKGRDTYGNIGICFSENDEDYDKENGTCFGSTFSHHPKDKNIYKIKIFFSEIKWILKRKYFYRNTGIELFTSLNKAYYFIFKDEETHIIILNEIIKKMGDYLTIVNDIKDFSNVSNGKILNDTSIIGYQNNANTLIKKKFKFKMKKSIKLSKIINKWKNWEISNFELLILLNIFANRSYNDISQYPVFPWLLTNYTDPLKTLQTVKESEKENKNIKDNENEENKIKEDYTYRDLSLQMGMLTINEDSIKRKKGFLDFYQNMKYEGIKPYYFGCKYSSSTYVCHYLIRLFPFTHIHIEIQGTGFDAPNRLFISVEKSFKNATTRSGDIREIIPEFFFLPEMFKNLNNLNMDRKADSVNDAITPCENNPYKFISTMRNVLENETISYTINNWIDLIFGYKAKGKEAEICKNVFSEESYQEDVNLNEKKDKADYMRNAEFGTIPNQLFNIKEFPKRDKLEEIKKYKQIIDCNFNLRKIRCKKSSGTIIKHSPDLSLLTISHNSQDKLFFLYKNYLFLEEKISIPLFEKDYIEDIIDTKNFSSAVNKMFNYHLPPINSCHNIKIIRDGKIILIGGYYDGKLLIIDFENNRTSLTELYPFKDESQITSIYVDKYEDYLFVGNSFGNVRIMQIEGDNVNEWKKIYLINNQMSSIRAIDINSELNVWSSASIDGCINIYTFPLCKLTRSFYIPSDKIINYIYICDSPLASIIVICNEDIYLYSINGCELFHQKEKSEIINPIIMKDFNGNDYLAYIINYKEIIIKNSDLSDCRRFENDTEIYYLCPGNDMKSLYVINKLGTQVDIILCDTRKGIEEK